MCVGGVAGVGSWLCCCPALVRNWVMSWVVGGVVNVGGGGIVGVVYGGVVVVVVWWCVS